MTRYGVAILGAGLVAGEYVAAFRDHPATGVVGIYSRTPGSGSALLETHGVSAREYSTEEELFEDDRVQIVVSCTTPDARPEHVVRAAETGRHVVIEKPVALSMAEVERIRHAVAAAGVKTVTSFVLRWNPQLVTLRKLIEDGVLGELIYAEADYWNPHYTSSSPSKPWWLTEALGRGAFVEGGCHAADMIRYLGGEVTEVTALSAPAKQNLEFEFDPVVVAAIRFENGAVGKLSAVLEGDSPYTFNVRLLGTEGAIQDNRVYSSARYPGALDYWEFPTIAPDSGDVSHHPFHAEIGHFLQCIADGAESHASIHDTYRSMAIVFAIEESLASDGRPVRVADVIRRSESGLRLEA
jgi:UDP-N-acetyl-2-amino-2-deoxyglucuronate dehydrogenase